MKEVTQRLRDGRIELTEVPLPELGEGCRIVDIRDSVVSIGTGQG